MRENIIYLLRNDSIYFFSNRLYLFYKNKEWLLASESANIKSELILKNIYDFNKEPISILGFKHHDD